MILLPFAIFGIPLALQTYTLAGRLLLKMVRRFIHYIERRLFKVVIVNYLELKTLLLIAFVFLITLLLAGFYATLENFHGLSFIDGLYFWFVSLTTIGYGDITTPAERYFQNPYMIIFDDVFTVLGLGVVAATVDSFCSFFTHASGWNIWPCRKQAVADTQSSLCDNDSVQNAERNTRILIHVKAST